MFLLTEYWSLDKSHTPIHVFVTNFDTVEYYFHTIFDIISIYILVFQFYITWLNLFDNNNSSYFSDGTVIPSKGFVFRVLWSYELVTASAILFTKN